MHKYRKHIALAMLTLSSIIFSVHLFFLLNMDVFFQNYAAQLANTNNNEMVKLVTVTIYNGGFIKQFPLFAVIGSSILVSVLMYLSLLNYNLAKKDIQFNVLFTRKYWTEFQSGNIAYTERKRKIKRNKLGKNRK